jgi:hypothetical protein
VKEQHCFANSSVKKRGKPVWVKIVDSDDFSDFKEQGQQGGAAGSCLSLSCDEQHDIFLEQQE